jgi:hypothetical protein
MKKSLLAVLAVLMMLCGASAQASTMWYLDGYVFDNTTNRPTAEGSWVSQFLTVRAADGSTYFTGSYYALSVDSYGYYVSYVVLPDGDEIVDASVAVVTGPWTINTHGVDQSNFDNTVHMTMTYVTYNPAQGG